MPLITGCTISSILPYHDPNEGRDIINDNFRCIEDTINFAITGATTGNTIVQAGANIVLTGPGLGSIPPLYIINIDDDIIIDSISATTISATTYYVGDVPLSAITSGLTYSNATPTTATVGGIEVGSTFLDITTQGLWDTLLYPYQSPAFSAFSIDGQSTTVEVGEIISSGSTLFTWSTINSSNVSANTLSIFDITNSDTIGTGLVNDGSEILALPFNVSKTTATSNQWRITALDTELNSFLRNYTVNWSWRIYYGTDIATTLTAGGVTGLTNSSLSDGFEDTLSYIAGDYKYFAYPSLMGTATVFKDSETSLSIAMEDLYTTSITNINGVSTIYNVHRTTNILGSTINIIIS